MPPIPRLTPPGSGSDDFMKVLKQRFSSGFNRTWERKGTLWEERLRHSESARLAKGAL